MTVRIIPEAVRRQQTAASDPAASVFVAANAGAGKTHVLAQRVIRLMLDGGPGGVDPSKILCITFTKAAAANMATRVYDRLKGWIALDDDALDNAIREIGVTHIDAAKRQRARRLFALALETPGGLKVQTIHAFCTRVLQQFPFEADVGAHFSVLEDRTQKEMLERARMAVLLDAAAGPEKPLGSALRVATAAASDTTLVKVLNEAITERAKLAAWMGGGMERALAQLSAVLGVHVSDTRELIEKEIIEGPYLPLWHWADVAAVFETGSKMDKDQGARLAKALASSGDERIEHYLSVFVTGDGTPRKKLITNGLTAGDQELLRDLEAEQERVIRLKARRNGVICRDRTAALAVIAVEVIKRYTQEKERRGLLDYDDLIDKTHRLLTECDPNWVHHKLDHGFDHILIDEAQDTSERQWDIVRRLVSEFGAGAGAGPPRLRTVFAVGDEKQSIFSFQGAAPREYDAARRHFEKRFTGSDVAWRFVRFDHSFRSGENVLGAVDAVFREPAIYQSITSDHDGRPVHLALPGAVPGLVDIWPLVEPDPAPELTAWEAPFDEISETSPQVRLAAKIAATVRGLIDGGAAADRERRPMRYGDVLILVRQRGPLFGAIIRALKNAGVAVAGADRLVLTEHIAIIDLLALADALLLEQDDLALAVALKSPLFGVDDDLLFELAHGRGSGLRAALKARACERDAFTAADRLLSRCSERARCESPFAFFAWLLGPERGRQKIFARLGYEAADALDEFLALALTYEKGEAPSLQGFVAWLRSAATEVKRDMETTRDEVRVMTVHGAKGLEAPVVILADTTTAPRGSHPPTLIEIAAAGGVPGTPPCVVWAPRREDDVEPVAHAREAVLDEYEDEHRRLLYVAMTRAAERLIVCGCLGKTKLKQGCWYELIVDGLKKQPGYAEIADGDTKMWRYCKGPAPAAATALSESAVSQPPPFDVSSPTRPDDRGAPSPPSSGGEGWGEGGGRQGQTCRSNGSVRADATREDAEMSRKAPIRGTPPSSHPSPPEEGGQGAGRGGRQVSALTAPSANESADDLPAWLTTPVPAMSRAGVVSPSSALPDAQAPQRRTPAEKETQAQAQARGTLIHRLLQSLPDIDPGRREAAAHTYLARAGAQFGADERNLFASQALAILADPEFAALFAPGSRAEVPIVGRLARANGEAFYVSGQIDRLAVTADTVLIGDYKTNRDPPKTVGEAASHHPHYVGQLALYRALLGKIYPHRAIRAVLLWTEIPGLMELPAAQLEDALALITSG
jgi:ATP-dependent helicase/nuclease subunit A